MVSTYCLDFFPICFQLENFVRICGDSPLHDPSVIRKGIEIFCSTGCDLATNLNPRTFPKGVSVEVVDAKMFLAASREISELRHREHPTTYFYDNPNKIVEMGTKARIKIENNFTFDSVAKRIVNFCNTKS